MIRFLRLVPKFICQNFNFIHFESFTLFNFLKSFYESLKITIMKKILIYQISTQHFLLLNLIYYSFILTLEIIDYLNLNFQLFYEMKIIQKSHFIILILNFQSLIFPSSHLFITLMTLKIRN